MFYTYRRLFFERHLLKWSFESIFSRPEEFYTVILHSRPFLDRFGRLWPFSKLHKVVIFPLKRPPSPLAGVYIVDLRSLCSDACEFESRLGHQQLRGKWRNLFYTSPLHFCLLFELNEAQNPSLYLGDFPNVRLQLGFKIVAQGPCGVGLLHPKCDRVGVMLVLVSNFVREHSAP